MVVTKESSVATSRRARLLERIQVLGGLAIGFVVLLVYSFPGFMSPDSVQQLEQARSHKYGDWHPPTMAAIWTLVDKVVEGPAGMLILQGSLFLAGVYLLLRRYLAPRAAALTASGVLIFPPVLAVMACIWKDAQMAGFLILGIALLLQPRRWQRVIAILLLVVACALRDNAAPAVLPILLLKFRWNDVLVGWKRVVVAGSIWVVVVCAAFGLNRSLTRVHEHSWTVSIAPADIVGVLKTSRDYSDEELLTIIDPTELVKTTGIQAHARKYYKPTAWFDYEVPGSHQLFLWPENPQERAAIQHAWRTLVWANPRAYLRHRLRVFRGVLGLTREPLFGPVYADHYDVRRPEPQRFYAASGIQATIAHAFVWLATKTPLFYPYIYMLILLAMLPLMWRQRTMLAIVTSGLLYELAMFPFAPSADVRYSHWPMTAAVLSIIVLVATRVLRRKESESA